MKKFGTFSGVFTPSILTILGVIMYLRFPAIIGQAGLINTIGIIVIAHIISFSTSLSVASLATDKTVKTGGTYFMISRSLGLSIGGTLGLALFVGLSFSVSLYLIGFAESFLAYWNIDSSINSIRLTGTIILMVVTTITFISTSLAIKSQYFIMAAIVLSLLSIFLGHHSFAPQNVHFAPLADSAPLMILFGIFFPAVTGFEAGVSMSGDLKDAKKSLPLGAVSAVIVGFIVYIGLAFFYTYTVDAEALKNDNQILFKIALIPQLVIIGIWGATLSSALGSILAAPRILQAIAMDKIAPKIFAKGTGETNEPRNALLLSFVIAEAGILIGQLDVIARIVSMFFITTYAFLNLASAIESWSSSDFRPAFKIPRFVSIMGAAAAFIVMILLDFLALTGAVVVLGLLYFYLRRKELFLETGDAWSSFWTNLAKHSLLELTNKKTNSRNWRPNIILFSGGEQARPHLVEMGLAMSGKLGALTDFELILDSRNKNITKIVPPQENRKNKQNFFIRQYVCDTIENGIKSVTSVYGFSGFEPNTIMMGWSRDVKNAGFLVKVLDDFRKKNLNAVFVDYDKNNGFGKKENIDIWWGGKTRHLDFALSLLKFIVSDHDWRDAKVRIIIINNDITKTDRLYRKTTMLLEERRINASVKVISDEIGTRSNQMIISTESANADLVMLGMAHLTITYAGEYIESISHVSELPASLLILNPSEEFEEINFIESSVKSVKDEISGSLLPELRPFLPTENNDLKIRTEKLDADLQSLSVIFSEKAIKKAILSELAFMAVLKEFTEINLRKLEKSIVDESGIQRLKTINKLHFGFLNFSTDFFKKQVPKALAETKEILVEGITDFISKAENLVLESPETIMFSYTNETRKKLKNVSLPNRKLIAYLINAHVNQEGLKLLTGFHSQSEKLFTGLKSVILLVNDLYEKQGVSEKNQKTEISDNIKQVKNELSRLEQELKFQIPAYRSAIMNTVRNSVIELSSDLSKTNPKKQVSRRIKVKYENCIEKIVNFPDVWLLHSSVLSNAVFLDSLIISEQKTFDGILSKNNDKIKTIISERVIDPINSIIKNIDNSISGIPIQIKDISFIEALDLRGVFNDAYSKITEFIERLPKELEISDFTPEDSETLLSPENHVTEIVEPNKIGRYYLDTRFYEPFYRELEQLDMLVRQTVAECREANNLIKFRLANVHNDLENISAEQKDVSNFLAKMKDRFLNDKTILAEAIERIKFKSEALIKDALSPLYSHSIIQSERNISSLLREQKGKKFSLGISGKIVLWRGKANALIVKILYSSSDGVILAKKYLKNQETAKISIRQILDFAVNEMPDKKILTQIPVFYRTLFSSKSLINEGFWVPMEEETRMIKSAVKRHKDGYGGAVLITGVHGSGKTALTRYTASRFFRKERIFTIKAPIGGSVSPEVWQAEVRNALGGNDYSFDAFQGIPPDSVVLINDLELWWERADNGCTVLKEITEMIRVYGRKVFFILNCNIYAYHQINKIYPFEEYLLSIVECRPFDTKQLQQLILNRHKSSGLTFQYRNISEKMLLQLRMATLFHAYFNYSQGVQGVAMNAWIKNITKVDNQRIYLNKPRVPNIDILNNLDKDWMIIIALFVQHKNMNAEKLASIMGMSQDNTEQTIDKLLNAGILEIRKSDVYILNRNLEPFLVKVCFENGII